MGLRDRIGNAIDSALEENTDKEKTGFDPSACEGCPHRGGGALKRCGLCGCPTIEGFPLDKTGMTPRNCPRKEEHARRSGEQR